jgi:hypothetical protein
LVDRLVEAIPARRIAHQGIHAEFIEGKEMIEYPRIVRSRRALDQALAPELVTELLRVPEHEDLLEEWMELYLSPEGKVVELPKVGIEKPYEEGSIHTNFEEFQAFYQAMESLVNEEDQHVKLFEEYYGEPQRLNEMENDALVALGLSEIKSDEVFDHLSHWFRNNITLLRGPFPSTKEEEKIALLNYFNLVVAFGAILRSQKPNAEWGIEREEHFDGDVCFVPTIVLSDGKRLDFFGRINKAVFDPKPGMGSWDFLANFGRSLAR